MGRTMRPLDPAQGPVQEFAADLRRLRERAGNPPFRQLARRAHYSATTLSVACSGSALPSLEVTLAFVRACGGDEEAWAARWHALAAGGACSGARRPEESAGPGGPAATRAAAARTWRGRLPDPRRVIRPAPIAAAVAGAVAGAILAASALAGHSAAAGAARSPARPAGLVPAGLVPTGQADPPGGTGSVRVSPCDPGSAIVRRAAMRLPAPLATGGRTFPAGTVAGWVSLRYSPRCVLAWARFIPAAPLSGDVPGTLTLQSERVQDGSVTTLHLPSIVGVEGDPLMVELGCVLARATVRFAGGPTATAATSCFQ